MKDLKFSIFDIFSYALPGGIVLIAFLFLNPEINNLAELASKISKINFGLGTVLILASYVVGNAVDSFGSWIYMGIGMKIWGSPSDTNRKISVGNQRALVRNYSSENHIYIQQWKVIKTMSHNLSFAFLLLGIVAIIKIIIKVESRDFDVITLSIISLIFSAIFLHRAHIFDKWHYKDLTNVVNALHLQEKAKVDSEKYEK